MAEPKLTDKQQVWVTEYLKSFNASEAARKAGYKGKSNVEGARLLSKLSSLIETAKTENNLIMTADEVLEALSEIARGDMGDFVDDNSLSININRARENGKLNLIKKVKYVTKVEDDSQTDTVEFELYDRLKALELLGKYHALFKEKTEVTATVEHTHTFEVVPVDYRTTLNTLAPAITVTEAED